MSKQKKIMLLGGIYYLKPAIDAAHKLGMYVITADYLPDNIAHQWADEYVNVSIIDKEAVLKVAREKEIDGILSFAVDPGVVAAAYVAEQMNLPFACSYNVAYVLQNKDLFRKFLLINGFNTPFSCSYDDKDFAYEDVCRKMETGEWMFPIIVKPTDSAGSKGVAKVSSIIGIKDAIDSAFEKSICGKIIIEKFLEKDGTSSGSELFVVNGQLIFDGVYDQYFDTTSVNVFTPAAEYWPTIHNKETINKIFDDLQRLISLLNINTGLLNVEWRKSLDGKLYIMELSPRAGGNRLSEVLKLATGQDIILECVKAAVGIPVTVYEPQYDGYWADIVLHSSKDGLLKSVDIYEEMKSHVKCFVLYQQIGSKVNSFSAANAAIGSLFLQFDSREELDYALNNQSKWLKIDVE